jgi:Carboxypeptidase regulatory-like domain
MNRKCFTMMIGLAVLLSTAVWAPAQTATTGMVAGWVTDATGAAIPNAPVALTSDAGVTRATASGPDGHYRFVLLPPGVYKVVVSAPGFKELKLDNVVVQITATTTADATLGVAGVVETVNVTAEAPLVNTTTSTTGRVISDTQIGQLPLPTRNFQQLLALSPGAISSLSNTTELGRGDTNIDVNGQRTTSNNVVIDGTAVNSPGTNSTGNLSVPAPDSIQEFIVQTSLYDATQGRNSGGNVAVVTKSGTDQFHGDLYEFLRNDALNANDFFLNRAGHSRPKLLRNQFGGTLGGPIVKDKTFFFASYQGTRERNGASLTNSLMLANLPAGLTDNRSTAVLNALAADNGVTLNPIAQAMLQAKLPDGSFAVPSAAPNAAADPRTLIPTPLSAVSDFTEDQFNANVDQMIGTKNHLSGKFFFSDDPQYQANFSFVGQNPYQVPGYGGYITFHNRLLTIADTHILTPSLINQARFGYSRIYGPSHPQEPFTNADYGITNPLASSFPGLSNVQVLGMFSIGPTGLADQWSKTQTYEASDMVSWTHGRHFLRFGAEMQKYLVDFNFNIYSRGQINFNTFSQFLAGTPYVTLLGNGVPDRSMRAADFAFFVQEDFRATNSLTLNLGLRVGRTGGISEANGRLVNFDPAAFAGATAAAQCTLTTPCVAGFSTLAAGDPINPNDWHLAPRFGFAWKPFNKDTLVMRGGFGVYFDRFSTRLANLQVFNYPFDMVAANLGTGAVIPLGGGLYLQGTGTLANPFPANLATASFPLNPAQIPAAVTYNLTLQPYGLPVATAEAINGVYVNPNLRTPYVYQYNFGMQWEPATNWMADIGYVGSKSTKLINVYNMNQYPGSAPYTTNAPGAFTTNKSLFGFLQAVSDGTSNYNSLQASLTHRFAHGLQFLASYTFSKSLDYGSGAVGNELAVEPGDQQDWRTQYGPSDFNRAHRFVFSGLYDLPAFYKGDSGAAKRLINDWELTSIMTFQSGSPFSVICNNSTTWFSRADMTGTAWQESGSVESRLGNYFNPAAFSCAAGNMLAPYGTSPRNFIVGPPQGNVDIGILKRIPVTEKVRMEFRGEFFNAFNMVNFANPQNNVLVVDPATLVPTAGQISSSSAGPRVIQFALKLFF